MDGRPHEGEREMNTALRMSDPTQFTRPSAQRACVGHIHVVPGETEAFVGVHRGGVVGLGVEQHRAEPALAQVVQPGQR